MQTIHISVSILALTLTNEYFFQVVLGGSECSLESFSETFVTKMKSYPLHYCVHIFPFCSFFFFSITILNSLAYMVQLLIRLLE